VNTYDFFVGITVPLGIILVMTPPTVSIPNVNGALSIKTIPAVYSSSSPHNIPPYTAAP